MRRTSILTLALAAIVPAIVSAGVPAGARAEDAWHTTLQKGIDAAKKSGRPVFVLTLWKDGVCNLCDTWRSRVKVDADVAKQLARYEAVQWTYDGTGGAVIKWTLANGGKSTDPAAQLFVVGTDGTVLARCDDAKVYTPASVSEWLKGQADAWEKAHPRTALPFVRATVSVAAEGTTTTATCAEVDAAREAKRPLLLYFGRDGDAADKTMKADAAACRKFERTVLDSKNAADAATGWTLLRFDVSDAAHAKFGASLGVERTPALLVWEPAAAEPSRLPATVTAPDLAFKLRKLAPPPK